MTEKEYKKIISEVDLTSEKRSRLNELYEEALTILNKLDFPFAIVDVKKHGVFHSQMAIEATNYFNILLNAKVENQINPQYSSELIYNEVLKQMLLNTEIKSYELNKVLKIKKNDLNFTVELVDQETLNLYLRKNKFIEEIGQKYTLFKNAYKLIKSLIVEQALELLDDYTLFVLLVYALEKHYTDNKYDNYMISFSNALEDLINTKKVELEGDYLNLECLLSPLNKGYLIIDPFNPSVNLASNINDANIGEIRKLKKRISKMFEQVSTESGSSILTLNINPQQNANGTISWKYEVIGRNLRNFGGEFENTESEFKNATLKGYFRGLKAIVTSNIYNKNITVITKYKELLKCIEKDPSEADNNSRRKTITKYIEENKLLISYQIDKSSN